MVLDMAFERSKLITISENAFIRSPLLLTEQPAGTMPEEPVEEPEAPEEPAEGSEEEPGEQGQEDLILPVQNASETSEDFDALLKKAIVSIPDSIRKLLASGGYSVVPARFLSDVVHSAQDGSDSVAWNLVSSAFIPESKQVAIAESTADQNGNPIPSLNVEGLFRHSVGHLIDSLAPAFVTEHFHDKFSDLEKFKYAHTSDVARLGKDKQAKLAYYVTDGDTSRAECFAECFAAIHGGGATYTIDVMSKYFPAAMKQVKELLVPMEKGQKLNDPDQGDDQGQTDQEPAE